MSDKDFKSSAYELIDELEDKITSCFIDLFNEADKDLHITSWTERFNLLDTTGYDASDGTGDWYITFEDTKDPYTHFNLHMSGREPQDFSIDT